MFWLIGGIVLLLFVFIYMMVNNMSKEIEEYKKTFLSMIGLPEGTAVSDYLLDDGYLLLTDSTSFCIANKESVNLINVSDILEIEVETVGEDGKVISTHKNALGRAVVGGVLGGGVGAILGAVTADIETTQKLKYTVTIHTKNIPHHTIHVKNLDFTKAQDLEGMLMAVKAKYNV